MPVKRKTYSVQDVEKMSTKQARTLYSKLAYEARKRQAALSDKYGVSFSHEYEKLSSAANIDIARELSSVSKFLAAESTETRYKAARDKYISTWNKRGVSDGTDLAHGFALTAENYEAWRNFMQEMRNSGALDVYYDADALEDAFERTQRGDITTDDIVDAFNEYGDRYDDWLDYV